MKDITLLENYIQTLEKENQAKNKQRQTLYSAINDLTIENQSLRRQASSKQSQLFVNQQKRTQNELQILNKSLLQENYELANELHGKQQQINKKQRKLQQSYQQIAELSLKLQQSIREQKQLKRQLDSMRQQYKILQQQMNQYLKIHATPEQIIQMMNNYCKIEQSLLQKNKQNIEISHKYQQMKTNCEQLTQRIRVLMSKNNVCASTEAISRITQTATTTLSSRISLPCRKFGNQQNDNQTLELIIQNNKLIERIIELEREKNLMYGILSGEGWIRKLYREENPYFRSLKQKKSEKLKEKIQIVQKQNERIIKSLIIQ